MHDRQLFMTKDLQKRFPNVYHTTPIDANAKLIFQRGSEHLQSPLVVDLKNLDPFSRKFVLKLEFLMLLRPVISVSLSCNLRNTISHKMSSCTVKPGAASNCFQAFSTRNQPDMLELKKQSTASHDTQKTSKRKKDCLTLRRVSAQFSPQ